MAIKTMLFCVNDMRANYSDVIIFAGKFGNSVFFVNVKFI